MAAVNTFVVDPFPVVGWAAVGDVAAVTAGLDPAFVPAFAGTLALTDVLCDRKGEEVGGITAVKTFGADAVAVADCAAADAPPVDGMLDADTRGDVVEADAAGGLPLE